VKTKKVVQAIIIKNKSKEKLNNTTTESIKNNSLKFLKPHICQNKLSFHFREEYQQLFKRL